MNTPSHFLMTAALDKAFPRIPIVKSAFLFGSVAPDLPLWLLSIGSLIYYHYILGWSVADTTDLMFTQLYFHNPFWIAAHNFLHSPVLLLLAIGFLWRSRCNINSPERWLFWFCVACLLHTSVDILTHVDDGPLLFFPFEWTIRFRSWFSYWDEQYYGREVGLFELVMDGVLLIYLSHPLRRRIRRW
ncbi:MAG: metal-dependent hydrolase [Kastovskya adunca ATA6-11-RM4]|nr:metal-dependent hydrolase [Kastovskya adunca ATA6-11-RM4]